MGWGGWLGCLVVPGSHSKHGKTNRCCHYFSVKRHSASPPHRICTVSQKYCPSMWDLYPASVVNKAEKVSDLNNYWWQRILETSLHWLS